MLGAEMCVASHAVARIRIPICRSFLGEIFPGFLHTHQANVGKILLIQCPDTIIISFITYTLFKYECVRMVSLFRKLPWH